MKRIPLFFPFLLAFLATIGTSVFFPHFRLHPFAPFLALLYCRCSRMSSLWIASLCGLFFDLFSSEMRFGMYALSFFVTTLLLYSQKKRFYSDKSLALSLFTFLISMSLTSSLFIFSRSSFSVSINIKWLASDFILMSFFDALYAFVWFSLPMLLYTYCAKLNMHAYLYKILLLFKKKKCSE